MRAAAALALVVLAAGCFGGPLDDGRDVEAVGMWLWLAGIPGEAHDGVHADAIALQNVSFGVAAPAGAASAGSGDVAGVEVRMAVDKATPKLMQAVTDGRTVPEGQVIIATDAAGCHRIVLAMEDIAVTRVAIEGDPDRPTVTGRIYAGSTEAHFGSPDCAAVLDRLGIRLPEGTTTATSSDAGTKDLVVAIVAPGDGSLWPADDGATDDAGPQAVIDLQGHAGADVEATQWSVVPASGVVALTSPGDLAITVTVRGPPACDDPPVGYDIRLAGTAGVWDDTDIVHVRIAHPDPCPAGIRILEPEAGAQVVSESAGAYSDEWTARLPLRAELMGAEGQPWQGPTPTDPTSWNVIPQDQPGDVFDEPADGLESSARVRGVPDCDPHVLRYKVEAVHGDHTDSVEVEAVGDMTGCQ